MRFDDKVCIVTGGGSGIGRATCVRMAAEGGRVVVVDLHLQTAQQTVDEILGAGAQAVAAEADVGNSAQARAAIDVAVKSFGHIDVIVNDAAR